jgi:mono/diheme cytochrome c family protein
VIALALAAALAQIQTPSPAPVAPEAGAKSAQEVWEKRCVLCHGADGRSRTKKGKQLKAPDFTGSKWQKHTTDQEIVDTITNGVPKRKMPPFKDKLSEAEIQAMVPFLRSLAKK